ncbi:MAG: hypothetical protein ACTSO4_11280, partial [Promethearchaeota archaeon]
MLYISVTIILYLIFFSLITVFGNSVLILIFNFRGITWNYTFLEGLPFSIIIGLLLYLVYSYMFAFLGLFNFWYITFPLILIFLFRMILFLKSGSTKWSQITIVFKNFKNKRFIFGAIGIAIIFILQYVIFVPILLNSNALLSYDPYYWTSNVEYLIEKGTLNFNIQGIAYPPGFTLFCGGALLLSPNFATIFYFMKFGGLPYLSIYILIFFFLLNRHFKQTWLKFA